MNRILATFRNLFHREKVERDLDAEVRSYTDLLQEEKMSSGMNSNDARRSARMDLGGPEQLKEEIRGTRAGSWLETIWNDVRYALRVLRKSPGYALAAILTLALGVGANTAIFTVADAALLRSLPYPHADRLVHLWETRSTHEFSQMEASMPDYVDLVSRNRVFQNIAGYSRRAFFITSREGQEHALGAAVTSDFFTVLGVQPVIGRAFVPTDTEQGAPKVVMISQGVWQKRFAASPGALGKSLILNAQNYTIIGVLPASFQFAPANLSDVWVPLFPDQNQTIHRYYHWLNVIARLKPGVSIEQSRTAMNVLAQQLFNEHPDTWLDGGIRVIPLREQIVGNIQTILLVMAGTAGFVLLIGCANLANLSLARATTRHKEIAVRMALGAKRARILQQLLTESVVLSLLGGGLGLVWAQWGVRLILRGIPPAILVSAPYFRDVTLHTGELFFTLGLSVLTGIAFGLVPALRASRSDLQSTLKEGGRTSAGSARQRFRDWLIVSEVALSLVLLIGAGLMTRSLVLLLRSDPGFDPRDLMTFQLSMPRVKYAQPPQIAAMQQQLLQKIQNLPGVVSAGAIDTQPLWGGGTIGLVVQGRPALRPGEFFEANDRDASTDYFASMKIPLIHGRFFTDEDNATHPEVFIINKTLAARLFPNQDPVGQHMSYTTASDRPPAEIIGVVGDEKLGGLDAPATPIIYDALLQHPESSFSFTVRTNSNPDSFVPAIRSAVRELDPQLAMSAPATLDSMIANSPPMFLRRFPAILIGCFAALALVLSAVGIYGVIAYSITQRTREIGIRMALGAQRRDILRQIVRQGMSTTLIGVAVGLAGAFALTRVLGTFLFGVKATDPLTFIGVAFLLSFVALVASYVPARRATRVDPMVALRHE